MSQPVDPETGVVAPGALLAKRFRVGEVIGLGGMGAVMSATDEEFGVPVAIKVLKPKLGQKKRAVARFLREAQATAALRNPHVVRVFAAGHLESGAPYIAMELLVGRTLGEVVDDRGSLPIPEALSYLLQAGIALGDCHAHGIVHRDLKPDNIMVCPQPGGEALVKLLDFGVSKSEFLYAVDSESSSLTSTTDVFGTPTHMSPEQIRSTKSVDHRTDIWSLGVVAYEVLTGVSPFQAETLPALTAMIIGEEPPPPHHLRKELPLELSLWVTRCLAKARSARPQTIADWARLVDPFVVGGARAHLAAIYALPPTPARPDASAAEHRPSAPHFPFPVPAVEDPSQGSMQTPFGPGRSPPVDTWATTQRMGGSVFPLVWTLLSGVIAAAFIVVVVVAVVFTLRSSLR